MADINPDLNDNLPESTEQPWVPDDSTFGARLALVRWKRGWNTSEAGRACDIAPSTWAAWEAGTSPRNVWDAAKQIAGGAGCEERWIVFGQNWKKISRPDLRIVDGGGETDRRLGALRLV